MRALSTSSGAVMFIPDEIERKTEKVSYADLAETKVQPKKQGLLFFGRRKPSKEKVREAA